MIAKLLNYVTLYSIKCVDWIGDKPSQQTGEWSDLVARKVTDTHTDDEAARFDVDFSIMSLELANFIPCLLAIFGSITNA